MTISFLAVEVSHVEVLLGSQLLAQYRSPVLPRYSAVFRAQTQTYGLQGLEETPAVESCLSTCFFPKVSALISSVISPILSFCADSAICFKRCLFFCFYYFIQHLRVSVWRRLGCQPAVFARTKSKSEQLCNRLKWRNGICAHKVFSYSWEGKRWRKSKIVKHFSWNKMLNQESK